MRLNIAMIAFLSLWLLGSMADTRGAPAEIKPAIKGIISMGTNTNSLDDAYSFPKILSAYVINVRWNQIQPTTSTSFNPQLIDQALDRIRQYNLEFPDQNMRAILRIWGGESTPDWLMKSDGGGIRIKDRRNKVVLVAKFWTQNYMDAWEKLQVYLSQRYDRVDLVAQVSNTACAHLDDESFVTTTDSESIATMYANGFSNEKYLACLQNSIVAMSVWKATPIDFALNPFEETSIEAADSHESHGKYGPINVEKTIVIAQKFRRMLAQHAIVSNHNLSSPIFSVNSDLYAEMKKLGAPIQFQTASPGVNLPNGGNTGLLKSWQQAMDAGINIGASAIELWPTLVFNGKLIVNGWNPSACEEHGKVVKCGGWDVGDLLRFKKRLDASSLEDKGNRVQ